MSAEILRFPGAEPADGPAPTEDPRQHAAGMLRWYADEIAAGKMNPEAVVLLLHHGEHLLPEVIGAGAPLNRLELAGLLHQASLRVQAVAFRGAHVVP